jgi:hypothetical protein
VLGGQQRALGRRALLRLRDRQLIVLQQRQHGFSWSGVSWLQRGLTILLANKIAHRLAVIALASSSSAAKQSGAWCGSAARS